MKNQNHEVLLAVQKVFRGVRGNPVSSRTISRSRSSRSRSSVTAVGRVQIHVMESPAGDELFVYDVDYPSDRHEFRRRGQALKHALAWAKENDGVVVMVDADGNEGSIIDPRSRSPRSNPSTSISRSSRSRSASRSSGTTRVPFATRDDVIVQWQVPPSPPDTHTRDFSATHGGAYVILNNGFNIGNRKSYASAIQHGRKHAKRLRSRLFSFDKKGHRKLIADYRD